MSRYYPKEYEPYGQAIEDEPSALRRWLLRYGIQRRWRAITAHTKGGRLLDVGCATGIFLAEMRHHGEWELHGVETSREAATYARTRFGLDIFTGELEEAGYPDCYFDVITLWDVLEHLPDPRSALLEMRRIIRPDGTLFLQIPNPDGLEAKVFGKLWVGLDVPRHLYIFSQETLSALLKQVGFELMKTTYLTSGYATFVLSLRFALQELTWPKGLISMIMRAAASTPVHALSLPLFLLIRALGKGSEMLVYASKA